MPLESLKYRKSSRLAMGGMAVLDRIVLSDGRPAVLRELQTSKIFSLPLRSCFQRGTRVRAALSPHPNIVNSLERGSRFLLLPYEIIEFVDGVPLRNLMTLGDTTLKARRIFVLREMAQALAWVHGQGLMHLDVKPENFLLQRVDDSFIVKLTDFDLTRRATDCGPRRQLGTPGFMAPEQFLKHLSYPASDVFAFGLIAYQLLTGKLPFSGKTPRETWRHQASSQVLPRPIREIAPQVSPDLERVVMRCLKKDLAERYDSMQIVARHLDEATVPQR